MYVPIKTLTMKNSIFVGLLEIFLAISMVASGIAPTVDAKRGCNENTNRQTGNPHSDQNDKGNPHDNNQPKGNPHNECVLDDDDGSGEGSSGGGGEDGNDCSGDEVEHCDNGGCSGEDTPDGSEEEECGNEG
jgi:hypothetical protein